MHMMLSCFAQSLVDALSLRSVAVGCSLTSFSHWGMLPHFAQSLGGCSLASLSRWGDAPSLCSVTGRCSLTSFSCWGMLPRFAQSLGGRSLISFSHWGDAPSLHSVTGGMLPHFTQSLGAAPSLRSVAFHSMISSNCSKICILEGQRSSIFMFRSLNVGTSIRLPKY